MRNKKNHNRHSQQPSLIILALIALITLFNIWKTPIASAQPSNTGLYTDVCTPPTISNVQTYNVKTRGAIGDGNSHALSERYTTLAEAQAVYPRARALTDEIDDMVIQKSVDDAAAAGGGKIYFPAGTYIIDREVVGGADNTGAIIVISAQNLIFEGEGIATSIIKMKVKTWYGDSHILRSSYSSNLIFRNLTLDGSRTTATFADEQNHGLYFSDTQNILIENVKFYQLRGDGIFTISDNTAFWTENMTVRNNQFSDNGRSGAAHQGGTRKACYVSNSFEKIHGQDLDFEATGDRRAAEDVWILNNNMIRSSESRSLAPSGSGTSLKALRYRIIGNTITGGAVFIRTVDDLIFEDNTILNTSTQPALEIGIASNVRIKNNTIENSQNVNQQNQPLMYIRANEALINVEISTNTFIQRSTFENPYNSPFGIYSEDFNGDNVTFDRNKIIGAGIGYGIYFAGVVDGNVNDSLAIRDNTIQNWKHAIRLERRDAAPNTRYTNTLIAGNTLSDTQPTPTQTLGIEFGHDGIVLGSNMAVADNTFGRGLVTPLNTHLIPVAVSQLEQVSCDANGIIGWSFDSSVPSNSNRVRIFVDSTSTPVATVSTTLVRSEVNTLFGITGTHGFQFSLPSQFKDSISHKIYAGAVYLDGSFGTVSPISKTVQCAAAFAISDVIIAKTGYRTAIFSWTTNKLATSRVEFGSSVSYGKSMVLTSNTTTHYVLVSDMTPGALHHFRVVSVDATGNTATSNDFTITTKARLAKPPKPPSLSARSGSVILNWGTLDYDLCERIEIYRSKTSFVQTTSSAALIATVGCADITYTDTTTVPSTAYYYSLFSVDDQGAYSDTTTISFATASGGSSGSSGVGSTIGGLPIFIGLTSTSKISLPITTSTPPILGSTILLPTLTSVPIETPTSMTVIVSPVFNKSLDTGIVSNDVQRLQKLLNMDPATRVSNSGAGSPGRETNYFGLRTQRALQKFQKKYEIISFGSPKTTGYGRLGPKTLAKFAEVFGAESQNIDSDGDGLSDSDETLIWHSDPLNADTDGDGYPDGHEVKNGYSPIGPEKLVSP